MALPDRPNYDASRIDGLTLDLSMFEQTSMHLELTHSNTNIVELIRDKSRSALYVIRTLRYEGNPLRALVQRLSEEEFPAVGFEGEVASRSMKEQADHMRNASALGLAVPTPLGADEQTLIYPYIPGKTLSKQLKDGNTDALDESLKCMADAHRQGIIHGDPYPSNWIVQDNATLTRIDFDIKLQGKKAKELELAQFLWAISDQTTDIGVVADLVSIFVRQHPKPEYEWDQVRTFVEKYENYLRRFSEGRPRLGQKLEVVLSALV